MKNKERKMINKDNSKSKMPEIWKKGEGFKNKQNKRR